MHNFVFSSSTATAIFVLLSAAVPDAVSAFSISCSHQNHHRQQHQQRLHYYYGVCIPQPPTGSAGVEAMTATSPKMMMSFQKAFSLKMSPEDFSETSTINTTSSTGTNSGSSDTIESTSQTLTLSSKSITATPIADKQQQQFVESSGQEAVAVPAALTGTVNERLLAELQQAKDEERFGKRSKIAKKLGLDAFASRKTDEERRAAIEEARNLNGVNPVVTLLGSVFALAVAFALWAATTFLGVWFAQHPVDTDVYFVARSTAVVRNVAMGLISLASGFFGVCGLGIFLLTIRVAYGVFTGELDPTPIVVKESPLTKKAGDDFEMDSVWDLMLSKKKRPRDSNNRR